MKRAGQDFSNLRVTSDHAKHKHSEHNHCYDPVQRVPLNREGEDRKYDPSYRGCNQEEPLTRTQVRLLSW